MAVDLAEAVKLHGVMDLEVILHEGQLKLLEIDARLPSQTPIAVYWSTGCNMVLELGPSFSAAASRTPLPPPVGRWWLEHLHATGNRLEVAGEHVLCRRAPLRVTADFYGADEAINRPPGGSADWVATLIVTGRDREEAWRRRCSAIEAIRRRHGLTDYADPEPPP